jgi:hypothetical protein
MRLTATGLLALFVGSCATASLPRGVLRYDLGRGSRGDIEGVIPEMLIRAGYTVQQRRDTGNLLYFETAWHVREPFEDETEPCALECRSRVIVEARQQGGNLYSVTLRAENSFYGLAEGADEAAAPGWTPLVPSTEFREHVSELSARISLRIDAGVRVFRP